MAAPNIVQVANIAGRTATTALSANTPASVVSNAASSGNVIKINSIFVANTSPTAAIIANVSVNSAAAGAGSNTALIANAGIATGTTLIALDKASSIYLEEDKSITVETTAAADCVISYEIVSD